VQCAIGASCTWTREAPSEDGERGSGSCVQSTCAEPSNFLPSPPQRISCGEGCGRAPKLRGWCGVVWCGASQLVGGMSSWQMRSVTEPGIRNSAARAACCVAEAMFTLLRKVDDVRCSGLCRWSTVENMSSVACGVRGREDAPLDKVASVWGLADGA